MFYDRNVVSRAGFLIHEGGSYRLQIEFLAAVYYAEGSSELHRAAAKSEFTWIVRYKFVDPAGLSLEDFG